MSFPPQVEYKVPARCQPPLLAVLAAHAEPQEVTLVFRLPPSVFSVWFKCCCNGDAVPSRKARVSEVTLRTKGIRQQSDELLWLQVEVRLLDMARWTLRRALALPPCAVLQHQTSSLPAKVSRTALIPSIGGDAAPPV